ncbi:MAG TPA: 6-phosphogluconolactonase [Silvibacterium sp.]|jgi:6-phosphogluconolactonase|nr:6-phosphogluconolactonase [Silvibacterium sp.]
MGRKIAVEYRVYDGADALSRAAAEHFLETAQSAVAARGKARIAVSGGRTPKATFELLANPSEHFLKAMPWAKIELDWVDERCVPPDHPDSNYRMTKEAMLSKVPLKPDQVFRIEGELEPEAAAARYESTLRAQFRLEGAEVPRFDALALGMGDDGHTASLFPHTAALHELGRISVANHVPQQKESWRVTLTWPVIVEAAEVFFLIEGKSKADPLHRVLQGPYDPETFPSQLIQPKNGRLLFLLDRDAAALLPLPDAQGVGRLEIER